MTNIFLMHGTDDFCPVQDQNSQCNWKQLSRIDKYIYFLSTGKNSCSDIAYLLKADRNVIRNRISILFLSNAVFLYKQTKLLANPFLLDTSLRIVYTKKQLFVQYFYDQIHSSFTSGFIIRMSKERIESELFVILKFMIRVAKHSEKDAVNIIKVIVESYKLHNCTIDEYNTVTSVLLATFAYCIPEYWNADIEQSWKYLCGVFKFALLEVTTNYKKII